MRRRRLVVVRHAKSAWPPGVPDRERPLGPRGLADAPRMGGRIRDLVGGIDLAVVSPARRTQQTWQLIEAELAASPARHSEDRVYAAWGEGLLAVVRELPDGAGTVALVGHEPGVSQLVLALADDAQPQLRDRIDAKFPTCAVAVVGSDRDWADWLPGAATLHAFVTPKDLG